MNQWSDRASQSSEPWLPIYINSWSGVCTHQEFMTGSCLSHSKASKAALILAQASWKDPCRFAHGHCSPWPGALRLIHPTFWATFRGAGFTMQVPSSPRASAIPSACIHLPRATNVQFRLLRLRSPLGPVTRLSRQWLLKTCPGFATIHVRSILDFIALKGKPPTFHGSQSVFGVWENCARSTPQLCVTLWRQ